jgi:hypothetical protein
VQVSTDMVITGMLNRGSNLAIGGSVGIGTTSPAARLHVLGAANSNSTFAGWTPAAAFDNAPGSTQLPVEWRVGGSVQGAIRADSVGNLVISGKTGGTYLNFDGGTATIFGNGTSGEVARVTSGGSLGIGTTAPTAKLHVAGTAGTDGIKFPDGTLQTTAAGTGAAFWAASGSNISNTNAGSVGGPRLVRDVHEVCRDERARERRRQDVLPLIDGMRLQRRPAVVPQELRPQVPHDHLGSTRHLGPPDGPRGRVALAHVRHEGDDPPALIREPSHADRGV